MKPKICFCTIAFREESVEDIVRQLAAIGYDGVELWYNHVSSMSDAELKNLRKVADAAGITLEVISPYLWLTQSAELLEESMAIAKRGVEIAEILGIGRFRTFTDSGPTGIGSKDASAQLREQAVKALQEITALERSLLFVVETHVWTLADDASSLLKLLEEVGADNLKVLFQPLSPETVYADYNLLKGHIEHVHLQNTGIDGGPGWLDEGRYDLAALLRLFRNDGYDRTMSVEYCFKGSTWQKAQEAFDFVKLALDS